MAKDLTLARGTTAFSTTSKFGTHSLSGGVAASSVADLPISSTSADGGVLTTGTVEGFIRIGAVSGVRVAYGHSGWFWVGVGADGYLTARYGPSTGEGSLLTTLTVTDNAWHHTALVFDGGSVRLYCDGVLVASSATVRAAGTTVGAGFTVGGFGTNTAFDFAGASGLVDEVRVSRIARYSGSTYTVPTAAFTVTTSDTIVVYSLDNTLAGVAGPDPVAPSGPSDLVLSRGASSFSATSKFGSHSWSGGAATNASADLALSSTGADGGVLYTGTVEGFVRIGSVSGIRVPFGRSGWYWVGVGADGYLTARYGATASEGSLLTTVTLTDGAWHHVALVFDAGAVRLYADGALAASASTVRTAGATLGGGFTLGGFGPNSVYDFGGAGGLIDEVRISRIARYSGSTYTVPTAPFTVTTSDTVVVYSLNNTLAGVAGPEPDPVTWYPIPATDANVLYSPYNWYAGKTICSGAYLRAELSGSFTALKARFDVSNMPATVSQVEFIVDGVSQRVPVAAEVTLPIPAGNSWTKHNVQMTVVATTESANRWAAPQNTAVVFLGFSANAPVTALPVRARALYGVAVGDSIAEGVRTLALTAADDVSRNDARAAWALPLAGALGAELGVIGFGAVGVTRAGSGAVPKFSDLLPSLWSGRARSWSTPQVPDFVAFHVGTNDSAATDADALAGMLATLEVVLAATPVTTKLVVFPNWLLRKATPIRQACETCSDPGRVTYVDTTGWWSTSDASDGVHPYGYVNVADLVPRMAGAIREALNRGLEYVNVAGQAVPLSTQRR